MKPWVTLASITVLLGGCGVDDWVARTNAKQFRQECVTLGITPGTSAFSSCMMQQSAQRQEEIQRMQDRAKVDKAVDSLKSK